MSKKPGVSLKTSSNFIYDFKDGVTVDNPNNPSLPNDINTNNNDFDFSKVAEIVIEIELVFFLVGLTEVLVTVAHQSLFGFVTDDSFLLSNIYLVLMNGALIKCFLEIDLSRLRK